MHHLNSTLSSKNTQNKAPLQTRHITAIYQADTYKFAICEWITKHTQYIIFAH